MAMLSGRFFILAWFLTICLSPGAAISAEKAELPLGEEIKGLSCGIELTRSSLCPGEMLAVGGYLKVTGDKPVRLHRREGTRFDAFQELHILTPRGKKYVSRARKSPPEHGDVTYTEFKPGNRRVLLVKPFYLTDPISKKSGKADTRWTPADGQNDSPFSLRREGEYKIWLVFRAPSVDNAPENAWSGTLRSNIAKFTVKELLPERRRKEPTLQQLADLKSYARSADKAAGRRLETDIKLTENEGLALEIMRMLNEKAPPEKLEISVHTKNLRYLLIQRSGRDVLRIDGPYLKDFSRYLTRATKHALARGAPSFYWPDSRPVSLYLAAHPDDARLRDEVIDLAKQYANIPREGASKALNNAGNHRLAHRRLYFSWSFLIQLGVLKNGMRLDDAKKILGEPTDAYDGWVGWYYESQMHVNPCLRAKVEGEKVLDFTIFSR